MRTRTSKEIDLLRMAGKITDPKGGKVKPKPVPKASPDVRQAQALENLVSEVAKLSDKNQDILVKMIQELKPQPVKEWTELILIPKRNKKNLIESIKVTKCLNPSNTG